MASSSAITIFAMLSLILKFLVTSQAGEISVYWGQNGNDDEGSLEQACLYQTYNYVNIAFLNVFGNNQAPKLNLPGHCDSGCPNLTSDIKICQKAGIKVLLSIGGPGGSYNLTSEADAMIFAVYLWQNFLGGNSSDRPFGPAILDGIDFYVAPGSNTQNWDHLAKFLSILSTENQKVYLTAAPHCPFPDLRLEDALNTGVFDNVWVQFYANTQCDYTFGTIHLEDEFKNWTFYTPANKIFLGVPASERAAPTGFITFQNLNEEVLPVIKGYDKYGGVMLWNRYYDLVEGYSKNIKPYVVSTGTGTYTSKR